MEPLFNRIVAHLNKSPTGPRRSTVYDPDPFALAALLRELASCETNAWLEAKAKAYGAGHANDPQPWPPPAALDWLYVDLGDPNDATAFPVIDIPPFCFAPGGSRDFEMLGPR